MTSTEPVSTLTQALQAVHHFFRSQEEVMSQRHGISGLESDILILVGRMGPMKMKEIAAHYRLKLSTLTSVVDKAERRGILIRRQSSEDRRVVLVESTDAGMAIFRDYRKVMSAELEQFISQLQHHEREHLFRGFSIFLNAYSS